VFKLLFGGGKWEGRHLKYTARAFRRCHPARCNPDVAQHSRSRAFILGAPVNSFSGKLAGFPLVAMRQAAQRRGCLCQAQGPRFEHVGNVLALPEAVLSHTGTAAVAHRNYCCRVSEPLQSRAGTTAVGTGTSAVVYRNQCCRVLKPLLSHAGFTAVAFGTGAEVSGTGADASRNEC
jgi:hypothetical protein